MQFVSPKTGCPLKIKCSIRDGGGGGGGGGQLRQKEEGGGGVRERKRDRDTRELIACSSNDREQTVSEGTFVPGRIVSHGIYTVRIQSPDWTQKS